MGYGVVIRSGETVVFNKILTSASIRTENSRNFAHFNILGAYTGRVGEARHELSLETFGGLVSRLLFPIDSPSA